MDCLALGRRKKNQLDKEGKSGFEEILTKELVMMDGVSVQYAFGIC